MNTCQTWIVEDDIALGQSFAEIFSFQGIEAELISDGQAVLTRLDEIRPDYILLDLHLPKVSGLEILARIRADNRLSKTVVVVVSADGSLLEDAREKADAAILKPISLHQVLEIAERFSICRCS